MNLWELLQRNDNNIQQPMQIQPVIQDMSNNQQLTQELNNRALYSQPQDLSSGQAQYKPFSGLYDRLTGRNADGIEQLNREETAYNNMLDNSNIQNIQPMQNNGGKLKNNFVSGMFGRLVPSEIENNNNVYYDDDGRAQLNTGIGVPQRIGGFLNDYRSGFNENYRNGFNPSNLINDTGTKKGAGFRIGEALGTTGRFLNSPMGRGLITAGLIGLTGGDGLQALTFGGAAAAGNQRNVYNDKLYRNALNNYGIEVPQGKGYINNDTFKQLYDMQRAQNEADRLAQTLEWQIKNAEAVRALQKRGQDLNYDAAIKRVQSAEKRAAEAVKAKQKADEYGDIQAQLDNFADTFETVDNPFRYRAFSWQNKLFNNQSEEEANFNAQRTLLFNQIARRLSGEKGVLSDKDIERIDKALPTLADTLKQKNAKMKAVYALLDIKKNSAENQAGSFVNAADNINNDGWAF